MPSSPDHSSSIPSRSIAQSIDDELRAIVRSVTRSGRIPGLLQTTALVNEAWIRLSKSAKPNDTRSHAEFAALASRVIRSVLVDEARHEKRQKRGGDWRRLALSEELAVTPGQPLNVDLLALDQALTQLAELSERRARVVEMRFFGGMTVEAVAAALGVSTRTVETDWQAARAWLRVRLAELGFDEDST